jgi:hypothetical protein
VRAREGQDVLGPRGAGRGERRGGAGEGLHLGAGDEHDVRPRLARRLVADGVRAAARDVDDVPRPGQDPLERPVRGLVEEITARVEARLGARRLADLRVLLEELNAAL